MIELEPEAERGPRVHQARGLALVVEAPRTPEVRTLEVLALRRKGAPSGASRELLEGLGHEEGIAALAYLEAHRLASPGPHGWEAGPVLEAWQGSGALPEGWRFPALGLPVRRPAGLHRAGARLGPRGRPEELGPEGWRPVELRFGWTWRAKLPGVAASAGALLLPVNTDSGPAWATFDRAGAWISFGWDPRQAVGD